jgi:hypothetical protein
LTVTVRERLCRVMVIVCGVVNALAVPAADTACAVPSGRNWTATVLTVAEFGM